MGPGRVFNLDETSCHVVRLSEYGWIQGEVSKGAVGLDSRLQITVTPMIPWQRDASRWWTQIIFKGKRGGPVEKSLSTNDHVCCQVIENHWRSVDS